MAGQKKRSDLNNSTGNAGGKIEQQKAPRTENFLNAAAKEVETQTIAKDMPGHGAQMEKLKSEQLPNFPVPQSRAGEAKILHEVDAAVLQENALNNEGDEQHH